MDSVIRATMSTETFSRRAMNRVVTKPGGVTLPNGLHLSEGVHVSTVIGSMFENGEEPSDFHPFCYVDQVSDQPGECEKQKLAVQINQEYLPFGLGRHAW